MMKEAAVEIVRTLREHGYQSYLAGGCVRDLLLGREPADYDVATDATPQQVMRVFPRTVEVGARFGVVLVPVSLRRQRRASHRRALRAGQAVIRAALRWPPSATMEFTATGGIPIR